MEEYEIRRSRIWGTFGAIGFAVDKRFQPATGQDSRRVKNCLERGALDFDSLLPCTRRRNARESESGQYWRVYFTV